MLIDALVSFINQGAPLSLVGGAGVSFRSGVIDLLGLGQGVAPASIIGTATVFGMDVGIGDPRIQTEVFFTTALVAVGGSTMNIQFQGAPDAGAPTYLPGAWTTLMETGPLPAGAVSLNAVAARFDFPPAVPPSFRPRYLSLLFSPSAGGSFSAGAAIAPVTTVRDDMAHKFQSKNYSMGPTH